MAPTTIEKLSPFSPEFTWDNYTNYLYRISDDYGFLTVGQMHDEVKEFKMDEASTRITFSWKVEDFVDYLFDANAS
jgi:hypothetical protein